jgi:hypothetical protein
MTRDEAVEHVVAALPYPAQIRDWDTETESDSVRFTWRGTRYRFAYANSWLVEEIDDGMLVGSDQALLIEQLIRVTYVHRAVRVG